MGLISDEDKKYLKNEFNSKMKDEVHIKLFTQKIDCQYCPSTEQILKEISDLDERIKVEILNVVENKDVKEKYSIDKIPAIVLLDKEDKDFGIRYFGIPSGYEFGTLVEDIISVSSLDSGLSEEIKSRLGSVDQEIHIQVFITPTCPYCPKAVRTAHQFAIENDYIRADMIEATEFPELSNKYGVYGVPKVVINEDIQFEGAVPENVFMDYIMKALKK